VSKLELARLLGVGTETVDRCIREGAPVVQRGSRKVPWRINTAEFITWKIRREVQAASGDPEAISLNSARAEDTKARAELRRFELAKLRNLTLTREDATAIYREQVGEFRARLMELPGQIPNATEAQYRAAEEAINLALAEFSGLPVSGEPLPE
jgi:phage terminase Nu1 subunit (DNA packaging protein)